MRAMASEHGYETDPCIGLMDSVHVLLDCGVLGALLRQAQLFQPLGFFPAGPLLRLDGFLGGSLGVFETILPVSL